MDNKTDNGIEAIGRFLNNIQQGNKNRLNPSQDEIVGKSSSYRSNIKDYNTGECAIKSAISMTAFGIWTGNLIQFNDLAQISEKLQKLKEVYPDIDTSDFESVATKLSQNINGFNEKIMDFSITKQEFIQAESGTFIAERMSELSGLNITPNNISDIMVGVSVIGASMTLLYLKDKKSRLSYEEKIAEYSDDLRQPSERMRSFRNDRMAFDAALFFCAPIKNDGYLSTISNHILNGLNLILTMPKKLLREMANVVLKTESEKNVFDKSLTSLVETFGAQKEWLSIYLKDTSKKLNGDGYLENSVKLINTIKDQSMNKQSINSSSDYSYSSNINIIKADAQQQKLKNNILMSLNKAAISFLIDDPKSKSSIEAKKMLEKLKNLHNNKVEQKFDNYEAISHLAKSILNNGIDLKNKQGSETKSEFIKKELTAKLDKYSLNLSYKHFENSLEGFKEIYLSNSLSSNQIDNFDKSMKKILIKYKDDIYTEDGFQQKNLDKACKEVQMFFHQHKKYLNETSEIDAAYNLKDKMQVFFQDYQNRNIKPYEGTYLEFIEERLRVNQKFINSKDLNNDNTFAVNNHLQPNKRKI
jgi:hypothetical protein